MRGWIAFLGLWFCLASSAVAETRVALVIGNSGYGGVAALSNPKGDAALIAQTLGSEGFEVTLVQDATRAAMLNGLRSFSDEADRADWAVVYYAGHGIEVGGINYLLPTDAELREDRDVQDEAISLNRVLDAVANARKLRLVILDACRTNPFAVTMKRSISARAVDRGLAPAEPPAGILVVYAAAAGQVAEDGGGDHSPFTAALARRMLEPGLEVSHLFNVVTADVLDATGHRQRPYQYGSKSDPRRVLFRAASASGCDVRRPVRIRTDVEYIESHHGCRRAEGLPRQLAARASVAWTGRGADRSAFADCAKYGGDTDNVLGLR